MWHCVPSRCCAVTLTAFRTFALVRASQCANLQASFMPTPPLRLKRNAGWTRRQHRHNFKFMEHSTVIKSAHDGTTLEFTDRDGDHYRVNLTGPNFHGDCSVYAYEPVAHLSGFFRDMATSWRGWQGKKEWSSLEGELKLAATIDSTGHISLLVRLRSGPNPFNWTISAVLLLEAGSLEQIAGQVERFIEHETAA
jgi:hypothetical protein